MPSSCLALPNGDKIGPTVWGKWTSSVHNYAAKAEEVLNGMKGVKMTRHPSRK